MEPAETPLLVARDQPPPAKTAHVDQGGGPAQQGWARRALPQILCVLLVFAIAWGLRHAGYDLGFTGLDTFTLALLCLCLWKLELLRRDPGGDPAVAASERRRIGLVAWEISLSLASRVAVHLASAASTPLALKVALWVLAGLAMVLAFYLLFAALCGDSSTDVHELSPEERV
jgi:hypothetical protein